MGVQKKVIKGGNGVDRPQKGDTITISYTGYVYDATKSDSKGAEFDSTKTRGDFTMRIGLGQVIKGWDIGILETDGGMTLGERSTLVISRQSDLAYGDGGFPGLIPSQADLIFEVELKAINDRKS